MKLHPIYTALNPVDLINPLPLVTCLPRYNLGSSFAMWPCFNSISLSITSEEGATTFMVTCSSYLFSWELALRKRNGHLHWAHRCYFFLCFLPCSWSLLVHSRPLAASCTVCYTTEWRRMVLKQLFQILIYSFIPFPLPCHDLGSPVDVGLGQKMNLCNLHQDEFWLTLSFEGSGCAAHHLVY